MKTKQPAHRLTFAATAAIAAGLLTGALWSSQPAIVDVAVLQHPPAVVDQTIPSITITAKRMSKAEKARTARGEIDPAIPQLTVIGYRVLAVAALSSPL